MLKLHICLIQDVENLTKERDRCTMPVFSFDKKRVLANQRSPKNG
jgi:hypothetical protein